LRFRKERQFDWMRLKKVVPDISRPKKSRHFLMHRMSLKLLDNFQICEHSWPCLFHIKLLLSESDVSCLLRVRSVSFTSRAKGCIKFVHHNCLVSLKLSHRGSHLLFYLCQIRSHVRILIIMVVIVFRN
jgi:hypothetical protein